MRPEPQRRARQPVDLRGKWILLTGASSGIGEVAAEKLAAAGATVIVVARREHLLSALVARIRALNYYAPLRLIRGIGPGMIERGDGHVAR